MSAFYRAFTNPPKWTYALGLGVVLSLLKRHGLPDLPPNILAYISVAFFLFVIAKSVADSYLARIKPLGMSAPEEAPPAPKAPVPCGELSLAELKAFDGSDKSKPLYLVRLWSETSPHFALLTPPRLSLSGVPGRHLRRIKRRRLLWPRRAVLLLQRLVRPSPLQWVSSRHTQRGEPGASQDVPEGGGLRSKR